MVTKVVFITLYATFVTHINMCTCKVEYSYTCPECVKAKVQTEIYVKLGDKEW